MVMCKLSPSKKEKKGRKVKVGRRRREIAQANRNRRRFRIMRQGSHFLEHGQQYQQDVRGHGLGDASWDFGNSAACVASVAEEMKVHDDDYASTIGRGQDKNDCQFQAFLSSERKQKVTDVCKTKDQNRDWFWSNKLCKESEMNDQDETIRMDIAEDGQKLVESCINVNSLQVNFQNIDLIQKKRVFEFEDKADLYKPSPAVCQLQNHGQLKKLTFDQMTHSSCDLQDEGDLLNEIVDYDDSIAQEQSSFLHKESILQFSSSEKKTERQDFDQYKEQRYPYLNQSSHQSQIFGKQNQQDLSKKSKKEKNSVQALIKKIQHDQPPKPSKEIQQSKKLDNLSIAPFKHSSNSSKVKFSKLRDSTRIKAANSIKLSSFQKSLSMINQQTLQQKKQCQKFETSNEINGRTHKDNSVSLNGIQKSILTDRFVSENIHERVETKVNSIDKFNMQFRSKGKSQNSMFVPRGREMMMQSGKSEINNVSSIGDILNRNRKECSQSLGKDQNLFLKYGDDDNERRSVYSKIDEREYFSEKTSMKGNKQELGSRPQQPTGSDNMPSSDNEYELEKQQNTTPRQLLKLQESPKFKSTLVESSATVIEREKLRANIDQDFIQSLRAFKETHKDQRLRHNDKVENTNLSHEVKSKSHSKVSTPVKVIQKGIKKYGISTSSTASCLKMHGVGLKYVSLNLFSMRLKSIDLSKNQLVVIPEEISLIRPLEVLQVDNNHLLRLPKNIGKLQHLKILSFSCNKIRELPSSLLEITGLEQLMMHENQIQNIPARIDQFHKLEKLYLHGNKFVELSRRIGNLVNLKEFSLEWFLYTKPASSRVLTNFEVIKAFREFCLFFNFKPVETQEKTNICTSNINRQLDFDNLISDHQQSSAQTSHVSFADFIIYFHKLPHNDLGFINTVDFSLRKRSLVHLVCQNMHMHLLRFLTCTHEDTDSEDDELKRLDLQLEVENEHDEVQNQEFQLTKQSKKSSQNHPNNTQTVMNSGNNGVFKNSSCFHLSKCLQFNSEDQQGTTPATLLVMYMTPEGKNGPIDTSSKKDSYQLQKLGNSEFNSTQKRQEDLKISSLLAAFVRPPSLSLSKNDSSIDQTKLKVNNKVKKQMLKLLLSLKDENDLPIVDLSNKKSLIKDQDGLDNNQNDTDEDERRQRPRLKSTVLACYADTSNQTKVPKQSKHPRGQLNKIRNGSQQNNQILFWAIYKYQFSLAIDLINNHDADVLTLNDKGSNLLHILFAHFSVNPHLATTLANLIIAKGVHLNLIDKEGKSPLHVALRQGQIEAVRFAHCFNIDQTIARNRQNSREDVASLENQLFDFEQTSERSQMSVLHYVVRKGNHEAFMYLVNHDLVNVLKRDAEQMTPKQSALINSAFYRILILKEVDQIYKSIGLNQQKIREAFKQSLKVDEQNFIFEPLERSLLGFDSINHLFYFEDDSDQNRKFGPDLQSQRHNPGQIQKTLSDPSVFPYENTSGFWSQRKMVSTQRLSSVMFQNFVNSQVSTRLQKPKQLDKKHTDLLNASSTLLQHHGEYSPSVGSPSMKLFRNPPNFQNTQRCLNNENITQSDIFGNDIPDGPPITSDLIQFGQHQCMESITEEGGEAMAGSLGEQNNVNFPFQLIESQRGRSHLNFNQYNKNDLSFLRAHRIQQFAEFNKVKHQVFSCRQLVHLRREWAMGNGKHNVLYMSIDETTDLWMAACEPEMNHFGTLAATKDEIREEKQVKGSDCFKFTKGREIQSSTRIEENQKKVYIDSDSDEILSSDSDKILYNPEKDSPQIKVSWQKNRVYNKNFNPIESECKQIAGILNESVNSEEDTTYKHHQTAFKQIQTPQTDKKTAKQLKMVKANSEISLFAFNRDKAPHKSSHPKRSLLIDFKHGKDSYVRNPYNEVLRESSPKQTNDSLSKSNDILRNPHKTARTRIKKSLNYQEPHIVIDPSPLNLPNSASPPDQNNSIPSSPPLNKAQQSITSKSPTIIPPSSSSQHHPLRPFSILASTSSSSQIQKDKEQQDRAESPDQQHRDGSLMCRKRSEDQTRRVSCESVTEMIANVANPIRSLGLVRHKKLALINNDQMDQSPFGRENIDASVMGMTPREPKIEPSRSNEQYFTQIPNCQKLDGLQSSLRQRQGRDELKKMILNGLVANTGQHSQKLGKVGEDEDDDEVPEGELTQRLLNRRTLAQGSPTLDLFKAKNQQQSMVIDQNRHFTCQQSYLSLDDDTHEKVQNQYLDMAIDDTKRDYIRVDLTTDDVEEIKPRFKPILSNNILSQQSIQEHACTKSSIATEQHITTIGQQKSLKSQDQHQRGQMHMLNQQLQGRNDVLSHALTQAQNGLLLLNTSATEFEKDTIHKAKRTNTADLKNQNSITQLYKELQGNKFCDDFLLLIKLETPEWKKYEILYKFCSSLTPYLQTHSSQKAVQKTSEDAQSCLQLIFRLSLTQNTAIFQDSVYFYIFSQILNSSTQETDSSIYRYLKKLRNHHRSQQNQITQNEEYKKFKRQKTFSQISTLVQYSLNMPYFEMINAQEVKANHLKLSMQNLPIRTPNLRAYLQNKQVREYHQPRLDSYEQLDPRQKSLMVNLNKPKQIPVPCEDEIEIITPRDAQISSQVAQQVYINQTIMEQASSSKNSQRKRNPLFLFSQMKMLNEASDQNKIKIKHVAPSRPLADDQHPLYSKPLLPQRHTNQPPHTSQPPHTRLSPPNLRQLENKQSDQSARITKNSSAFPIPTPLKAHQAAQSSPKNNNLHLYCQYSRIIPPATNDDQPNQDNQESIQQNQRNTKFSDSSIQQSQSQSFNQKLTSIRQMVVNKLLPSPSLIQPVRNVHSPDGGCSFGLPTSESIRKVRASNSIRNPQMLRTNLQAFVSAPLPTLYQLPPCQNECKSNHNVDEEKIKSSEEQNL